MMQLDPENMSVREIYLAMVQLITPRPIAWVSTLCGDGASNLAPFSFFNGVGANPPTVVFCPVNRRDGTQKDSLRNVEATGEFVVNFVPFPLAESMNQSAAEYDEGVSEFSACGLTESASSKVRPPRVAESPAALECEMLQSIHLGSGPSGANLVIGRVVMFHINDELWDEGTIDPAKIDLVGRLGGSAYARTTDRFDMPRPPKPE